MHTRSLPAKAGNDGYAWTLASIKNKKTKYLQKSKMQINRLSEETIENLKKLIGGRLVFFYTERGQIKYGNGLTIKGCGMISIVVRKEESKDYFKLRLKFHEDKEGIFYTEFHEWNDSYSKEKSKLKRKRIINFDKEFVEDYEKYSVSFKLEAKKENRKIRRLEDKIKSIKIYHFIANRNCNFLSLIDFETETGRRMIIEEDDQMNNFYLYVDNVEPLNFRLNQIRDGGIEVFGEKLYQLKHEII